MSHMFPKLLHTCSSRREATYEGLVMVTEKPAKCTHGWERDISDLWHQAKHQLIDTPECLSVRIHKKMFNGFNGQTQFNISGF